MNCGPIEADTKETALFTFLKSMEEEDEEEEDEEGC